MRSSSIDAEGEEDDLDMPETQSPSLQNDVPEDQDDDEDEEDDDEQDEDADADQDDDDDDDESEIVGAVKRAPTRSRTSRARKSLDTETSEDDESASDGDNDSDSSDESAATQAPWEKGSDTAQEQDQDIVTDSTCVYVALLVACWSIADLGLADIADKTKKMIRVTSMKNISNAAIAGIMVSFYIIVFIVKLCQGL